MHAGTFVSMGQIFKLLPWQQTFKHSGQNIINSWPSQTTQWLWISAKLVPQFSVKPGSRPKHAYTNNFEIATMTTKIATQWSKSNQYMAISNNTLFMNFSQIGPPKYAYKVKKCCQQTHDNWGVATWQQLHGWNSPRPKDHSTKWDIYST